MRRWTRSLAGLLVSAVFALAAAVAAAPEGARPATGDAANPLAAKLEAARGRLDAADLEETFKAPIRSRLDEAVQNLEDAEKRARRTRDLEESGPALPKRIEALEADLAALPAADAAEIQIPEDVAELRNLIEQKRGEIARLEGEAAAKQTELTELKARPVEVGSRLPAAGAELAEVSARLAALGEPEDESVGKEVDRLLLAARREALQAEVAMLEREQVGQLLREQRTGLERQILEGRLRNEKAVLSRLEQALNQRVESEVTRLERDVAELVDGTPDAQPELAELAAGLSERVAELKAQAQRAERVSSRVAEIRAKLEDLRRENTALRRQLELGGLEGSIMRALLNLRTRLPDRRALDFELRKLEQEISAAQLEGFRFDDLQDGHEDLAREWEGEPAAQPVLELRARLLDQLASGQRALIGDLARLGSEVKAFRDLAIELSEFLSDQLFWNRSSKPVGMEFFGHLPNSAATLVSPSRWQALAGSLARVPVRHPLRSGGVALAVIALLAMGRRLRNSIHESGRQIRKISTDHLGHTLRALAWTLLRVVPVPLVLGFLAWALAREPYGDAWVRGSSMWCGWASMTLLWILALRELAREGGVGRVHFGWDGGMSAVLRRGMAWLAAIYLPAMFPVCVTLFEDQAYGFESIGRLGFVLGVIGLAWVLAGMLRFDSGLTARLVREQPHRLLVKTRHLWFWLLVGIPLVLAGLALAGYMVTALMLGEQFFRILRWITLGAVAYGVGLRGFMIKERRMALAEAVKQRKARRAAAEQSEEEGEADERVAVDEDQVELRLDDVARQTRRLLRSLVGIGVLVIASYSVAANLPLDQAGEPSFVGGFGWLVLFKALLIGAATWTVVKNLPGLLDILGLRESGMEPGTRYAVATLGQYALGATGILLVTNALTLDWSSFGWIAAALSVGLGFGLQEIVANFVCGIILLFERPIRVGDVVTVGEVSGTVSRIRMRATTITNWDRQEFVVPNKDFITGSLINWTLSSPLNRVTVAVGVAYGSDTTEARRLLAEVAADHPVVLDDPPPLVSFEAFADSTLNLFLRCYLPNLDNRLRTITELHEEVNRRFKQAGIEIAFPQRDLHLRSVPEALLRPGAAEREAG